MIYITKFQKVLAIIIIIFNVGFVWMIYEGYQILKSTNPSRQEIVNEFIENRERFERIAQYIDQIEQTAVSEPSLIGYTFEVYDGKQFKKTGVKNNQVHEDIKFLFKKLGFKKIAKYEAGVYFTKYTTWGYSVGIAFSSDKHKPFRFSWMILTHLSDDWFGFQTNQF